MNQIVVRDGKTKKDRITVLPEGAKPALKEHLVYVKRHHQNDLDALFLKSDRETINKEATHFR